MGPLHDFVVLFGVALAVLALSRRLRLPPIAGFILTGVVAGPSGLGWVDDPERIGVFAELGVVFLLFVVGLEFSIGRLRELRRVLLVGGGLQVGLTAIAASLAASLLGVPGTRAAFLGVLVAMSSTALVVNLYTARRELDDLHARVSLGILLLQDFLIVPLLVLVPLAARGAPGGGGDARALVVSLVSGVLVVAAVFVAGRYLVGFLLRRLLVSGMRELHVIGALFSCLGAALGAESLGFSPALGAFLAGILLAETDYRHQVLADTAPFRDVFNSIFFVSIGMLLDLAYVTPRAPVILPLTLGVILLKAAMVAVAVLALRLPLRIAVVAGLGLAQVGEFSFVLLRAGRAHALVGESHYQMMLAVAVLSMLATPALVAIAPRLAARLPGGTRRSGAAAAAAAPHPRVIIAGYGLHGRELARHLHEGGVPYLVIDADGAKVDEARKDGRHAILGDVTRAEILDRAGIEHAHIVVLVVNDREALRQALTLIRRLHPAIHVIARTRMLGEIPELVRLGANDVVVEEFESFIETLTRVLERLHVPGNVIRAQARLLHADAYSLIRTPAPAPGMSQRLTEALGAGLSDTYLIGEGHGAAGRSIAELRLRSVTGATIVVVIRQDRQIPSPSPDFVLEAGDILVLVGNHAAMEKAFAHLDGRG